MAEITKEYFDHQFESMAGMIKKGFDTTASKVEVKAVEGRLDKVEGHLGRLENKVDIIQGKLDNILYKEVVQIDDRVTKIEKHLGFKPA